MAVTTSDSNPVRDNDVAPAVPNAFDFDIYLVLIVSALLAFGLLMVYSTTFDYSYLEYGSPVRILLRQVRSLAVGLVALLVLWRFDYRLLGRRAVAIGIMMITILALGVLLLMENNDLFGAQRALFNGSVQPGEAAKLAVIIYFASWLASRRDQLHRIGYGLVPFIILVGAVGGLIVLQPDLSSAAIIVVTAGVMFFVAGANLIQVGIALVGGGVVSWLVTTQFQHARDRLADHLAAMQDLTQASWHVQQAIIAFTAPSARPDSPFTPNWFGIGLGQSRQKFGFLPAPHTDSIFAIIGEELGLFGCVLVMVMLATFVWRAFHIANEAGDPFGSMLAVGVGTWIGIEAMLNIAVMTAVLPFTGVTLPFISYGGSSLVVVMSAVGILMSISRKHLPRRRPPRRTTTDFNQGTTRKSTGRFARVGSRGRVDY